MNADEFVAAVRCHVAPALETCGFQLRTSVSGRMYDAEFDSPGLIVSISYEPGDDFFLVVVFQLVDGRRSDIDDRDATPRLSA